MGAGIEPTYRTFASAVVSKPWRSLCHAERSETSPIVISTWEEANSRFFASLRMTMP
jgi:hypothetical protein